MLSQGSEDDPDPVLEQLIICSEGANKIAFHSHAVQKRKSPP